MNYYKKYTPYLFLIPALAVLMVFFFIPFFQTFGLSFFDYSSSLYNPSFCGVDNYIKLFKEPVFYKVMFNTFLYLIIAVPFLVIFPSGNCIDSCCGNCFQMALCKSGSFKLCFVFVQY